MYFQCEPVSGLGFRRGSYKCVCKIGYYFPNTTSENRFFNGTDVEDEAAKLEEVSSRKKNCKQIDFRCSSQTDFRRKFLNSK